MPCRRETYVMSSVSSLWLTDLCLCPHLSNDSDKDYIITFLHSSTIMITRGVITDSKKDQEGQLCRLPNPESTNSLDKWGYRFATAMTAFLEAGLEIKLRCVWLMQKLCSFPNVDSNSILSHRPPFCDMKFLFRTTNLLLLGIQVIFFFPHNPGPWLPRPLDVLDVHSAPKWSLKTTLYIKLRQPHSAL